MSSLPEQVRRLGNQVRPSALDYNQALTSLHVDLDKYPSLSIGLHYLFDGQSQAEVREFIAKTYSLLGMFAPENYAEDDFRRAYPQRYKALSDGMRLGALLTRKIHDDAIPLGMMLDGAIERAAEIPARRHREWVRTQSLAGLVRMGAENGQLLGHLLSRYEKTHPREGMALERGMGIVAMSAHWLHEDAIATVDHEWKSAEMAKLLEKLEKDGTGPKPDWSTAFVSEFPEAGK